MALVFFIYILFIELTLVTVIAFALLVALVITRRKLDFKEKHISVDR